MPELISEKNVFSLLEVSLSIKKTISERYTSIFWVKAEMNKLNLYYHSGHCYPELVEKKEGKVVAQLRATIWKEDYFRINSRFQSILKEPLRNGIKILFCARITYDPAFGLSLNILDIDPVWSLGELEKEKSETIERLTKEGIFHANKKLNLPLLPKRIAVISVETSKGYADFLSLIDGNQWGYRFFHMLFPALLQGEKAIGAIRDQLRRIKKVISHFDLVVLVRGGGGDVGLSCYNNYELTKDMALFPIPVLTGIGHATNETVAEMISFKNAITPSALADFLIQQFHNFSVPVQKAEACIVTFAGNLIADERLKFNRAIRDLQNTTRYRLMQDQHLIKNCSASLRQHAVFVCKKEKAQLLSLPSRLKSSWTLTGQRENMHLDQTALDIKKVMMSKIFYGQQNMEQLQKKLKGMSMFILDYHKKELTGLERTIHNLSPEHVLKRGYSITRKNGKIVNSTGSVKKGDMLETIISEGSIISKVEETQK